MDKYSEKTLNWARRYALVGLLGVAATLVFHLYGSQGRAIQEKEESTSLDETSGSKKPGLTEISISSIHVSEVAMDIPAAFELGIQVGCNTNLAARDINVILDFGRAEIHACDYTPKSVVANVLTEDKSHRRIKIKELLQDQKFYIRCLISSPVFNQVIINGGNIDGSATLDFKQYQEEWVGLRSETLEVGFWEELGRLAAIFLLIIFCIGIATWLVRVTRKTDPLRK